MQEIDIAHPPKASHRGTKKAPLSPKEDIFDRLQIERIPFSSKLSFAPMIEVIKAKASNGTSTESAIAGMLLERLAKAPELEQPIEEESVLEKHSELMEFLMTMVVPPFRRQNNLVKVSAPFEMRPFYCTPALSELVEDHRVNYEINNESGITFCSMVINACSLILNEFYGQELNIDPPISISIQREGHNVERHYKTQIDTSFLRIKVLKPLKPLSQTQINHLLSNVYDIDLWLEHIPPEHFEFQGFVFSTLIDITEEEALSRLKYSLLERDAVVEAEKIERLQHLLRTYFDLPELRMGVTAIDYPLETAVAHKYKIRFDFLADHHERLLSPDNKGSIYEKACRYREILLVEDLGKVKNRTPIEQDLLEQGIKSIIVAPLFSKDDRIIGLLEIGAPRPFELHSFVEIKFKEIIGLFSMAVERSRDEIDNRIEAIIREQYTAVHPSVEWKFIETSYNLLEQRERDPKNAVVDPIVFNEVFPLYAQADIVSSSDKRNHAIQEDLINNLNGVVQILNSAIQQGPFPLLQQYRMVTERNIREVRDNFSSNDESRIVEWLQSDMHPLFYQLRNKYPELSSAISNYFSKLDVELGIIYEARRRYEQSVTRLNNRIASYLEEQQKDAQRIIPHYFERYKTDGVEYEIYVGQSMLNKNQFSYMHLKNLRLWQLIDMCNITRLVGDMQQELPVPLNTAQLVFVYSGTLSIHFRMDEKQFDVDGSYNVRYAILKKRIDKAVVEDTGERLTVPGKISIVYLQEKDRLEYLEYADYLIESGYIEEEIEDLKLGKLQGVQGLQALRFTVKDAEMA
jgi:hypothetical protein